MEIRIGKSAHTCTATGRAFVHDEDIHSLVRVVDGEFIREDYSAEAWNPEQANGAYSVWSAKYYDPEVAEREAPEVSSPLRRLFYESIESEGRAEQAKAFLAAQLLRRQKVFRRIKESDESDGETRIILFSDRIGNRLIEVRDPSFSYAEMDEARNALVARLQELEAPETPGETGPSEEGEPKEQCDGTA